MTMSVAIGGVMCEAEAEHQPADEFGPYSEVYVATVEGWPMYKAVVDGHLTAVEVYRALADLAAGRPGDIAWQDLRAAVAVAG